ncbi:MAG: hypothetical protein WCK74_01980 [Gemmatimonadaceae bacterium]
MSARFVRTLLCTGALLMLRAPALSAQEKGQAAFAAIASVVQQLEADPATDWARVDLERLRQHLIDMDAVLLRSTVRSVAVPGGARFDITGTGRTRAAIQRIVADHAGMLAMEGGLLATAQQTPSGMTLTVTTKDPAGKAVSRVRGLGFAGLLTLGEHHAMHHLMLARGQTMMDHGSHHMGRP